MGLYKRIYRLVMIFKILLKYSRNLQLYPILLDFRENREEEAWVEDVTVERG